MSSPKQKSQFSQNKFIRYKDDVTSSKSTFPLTFFTTKISNKVSKIADLTCKILRKFIFPTYNSFYVHLQHTIYLTLPLFHEMD